MLLAFRICLGGKWLLDASNRDSIFEVVHGAERIDDVRMTERVILHIGFPKTGTTSIQDWLYKNRADLRAKHGIVYPKCYTGKFSAHHGLSRIFCSDSGLDLESISHDILAEAAGAETVLLSCENWVRHEIDASRMRVFLRHLGAKHVQIICYVREHLDYTQSRWREKVRNRPFDRPFHEFALDHQEILNSRISSTVQWLEEVGQLKLIWFERNSIMNGNVLQDFCSHAGICGYDYHVEDGNPSIGGNLLLFKFAKNKTLRNKALNEKHYDMLWPENLNYRAKLTKFARRHKKFQAPFFISKEAQKKFRTNSVYNNFLFQKIGPTPLRTWESEAPIPDLDNLDHDLEIIFKALEPHHDPLLMEQCLGLSNEIFSM